MKYIEEYEAWYCNNCDTILDQLTHVNTTYEMYYGVGGIFPYSTPLNIVQCPYCGSEEVEGYEGTEQDD